ncbi:hypothetical protein TL16_g08502 [Triparma laevis f. inornata]|uniref:Uncharacterized protein n=2 Tax=Triparma laevis TaxID=1534972 RepID=A0A9W7CAV7_9STRA|nr:hypothetical protein TL16_g08502 [Triparma laevis f. inornata]GMI02398.1 hypothetical protein TrLO_g14140 [Triparma laevis f. longispina]
MPSPHLKFYHPEATTLGYQPSNMLEELEARSHLPVDVVDQFVFPSPGHETRKGRTIQGNLKSKPILISSGVADLIGKPTCVAKKFQERKRSVSSGERGRAHSMTKVV